MTKFAIIAIVLGGAASAASAQTLAQWDLQGAPGDQAFTAGSAAAGLAALNLTRGAGITPTAAANSLSGSGWNDLAATDYFTFGLTASPVSPVDLDDLYIGTRSSGTGPGNLGLFSSNDGFTANLFTFVQAPGGNFVNSIVDLSGLPNFTTSVEFRIRALDNVSAAGGVIGAAGTFRVTGYFVGGIFDRNLQLTGVIVPTPGAFGLLGLGGLVAARRRRA